MGENDRTYLVVAGIIVAMAGILVAIAMGISPLYRDVGELKEKVGTIEKKTNKIDIDKIDKIESELISLKGKCDEFNNSIQRLSTPLPQKIEDNNGINIPKIGEFRVIVKNGIALWTFNDNLPNTYVGILGFGTIKQVEQIIPVLKNGKKKYWFKIAVNPNEILHKNRSMRKIQLTTRLYVYADKSVMKYTKY